MHLLSPRNTQPCRQRCLLAAGLTIGLLVGLLPALCSARDYSVDAEASQIRIRVMRAGPYSILAHDHILVARGLAGKVTLNPGTPAASSASLSVPVSFLEIDDPKERAQEGFASELNESNRSSVRETMLGTSQLDAAQYPRVTIAVDRAEGTLPALRLHVRVKIRDREQSMEIPVTVSADVTTLVISGETDLRQSAFGITPYSALFGAIAVEDTVRLRFQIVAKAD